MLLRINGDDDGAGEAFARETLGIDGFPSFVVLDAQAREIDRFVGYGDPQGWASDLQTALADRATIAEKEQRFLTAPSVALAHTLGAHDLSRKQYELAIARYRIAQKLDPAAEHSFWKRILDASARAFDESVPGFDRARVAAIALEPFAAADLDAETQLSIATQLASLPESFDDDVVGPVITRALAASSPLRDRELLRQRAALLVIKALRFDHDPAAAVGPRRDSLPPGWQDDPFALNDFAWWCFEQQVNTEEAYQLARRGLDLLPAETPGARRAMILDTAAELATRRNDLTKASEFWRQAQQADPGNEHYGKRLASLGGAVKTE